MKKIDFTNYEAWLLDYAEGNLSAENTAELLLFLEQHPELKIDVEGLMEFTLPAEEPVKVDFKSSLLKDEADVKEHFEHLCLAYYDKSISSEEKNELDFILQQKPHWEKEFKAFGFTYFQSEPEIEFAAKASLKKQFQLEGSFDDQAVKAIEGLLSEDDRRAFEQSMEGDASKLYAWKAFQRTVLVKENLEFPAKDQLYQQVGGGRVMPIWTRWVAAAASIALLIGAFTLLNREEVPTGIAGIRPDTGIVVRPVKAVEQVESNEMIPVNPKVQPRESSPKRIDQEKVVPEIQLNESVADLTPKRALILEDFELPDDYLAISPEQNIRIQPLMPTAQNQPEFLSPGEFVIQKAKGLLRNKRIDVEKPIQVIKEDGLAETSYKSIERITRGNVNINREKTQTGSRVTGFSIGSLEFSRSTNR
ncbi:MAG TPA: hypothetical protein PL185_09075 [Flavobacteriales bacterium]|nr:hypothetical protein [Flavobacteriales bacterium]